MRRVGGRAALRRVRKSIHNGEGETRSLEILANEGIWSGFHVGGWVGVKMTWSMGSQPRDHCAFPTNPRSQRKTLCGRSTMAIPPTRPTWHKIAEQFLRLHLFRIGAALRAHSERSLSRVTPPHWCMRPRLFRHLLQMIGVGAQGYNRHDSRL